MYISYARYVFVSLRGKLGPEILLLQDKQVMQVMWSRQQLFTFSSRKERKEKKRPS